MMGIVCCLEMIAEVIVDITHVEVDRIFEYKIPSDGVKEGSRVLVPFGTKTLEGIVIRIKENSDFPVEKIKPIIKVLEETPALTKETLKLTDFIVDTCYVTKALALRLFLPSEMRKGKIKEQFINYVSLRCDLDSSLREIKKSAIKQKELLEYLNLNGKSNFTEMCAKFGNSAVNSLIKKGFLEKSSEKSFRLPYKDLFTENKKIDLTLDQINAVESIKATDKTVTLIHGVTGSGKTEIYLKLIKDVIAEGKTAIMLVPEIALTPQMLKQLRARFGDSAAIIHSGLSAGERFDEWWRLRNGEAKIAIGARSAIFAPLQNVGLVIIDEEHDGSYTSESSPRYVTVDVAKERAKYNGAKIVIGSATPSIDSYLKAINGEYNLVTLKERINKKPLPEVIIADMKKEVKRGNNTPFSFVLREELDGVLSRNEQAILFLNQRGFSKSVICTECGHVIKCGNCDVSLTYHMEDSALLCHYCGAKYKMVDACPECGSKFIRYGGVGTERVVSELKKLYPKARILRMDRDTTQNKESHFKIINAFANGEADILVGTQMIAKGHDFKDVTLVGILDADMSLHFSDYRSGERTFELLTQVAGRSGRADKKGKVVLQTFCPDNEVLHYAINYDYDNFFKSEISIRKATAFPPFTDIIRVLISAENEEIAVETTKNIFTELGKVREENTEKFRFFGCTKSPIKRLQNKFRYQVLMRLECGNKSVLDQMFKIINKYNNKNVTVYLEINPNNLS